MDGLRRLSGYDGPSSRFGGDGVLEADSDEWMARVVVADCSEEKLSRTLRDTIESEIIPRLMMAHSSQKEPPKRVWNSDWDLSEPQIETFTALLVDKNESEVIDFVDELRMQGAPLDRIYLELLAPAAQLLGEYWVQDKCHFIDVTIGLARIQELLRTLSVDFHGERQLQKPAGNALLSVVSPEQHTCGVFMVAEFFRREGWTVWCGAPTYETEIADLAREEWFEVIGYSMSRSTLTPTLKHEINTVRKVSKNPDVQILVGGKAFLDDPSLAEEAGADQFLRDGREAVRSARKLLEITN